jgi:hypothetical protein
MARARSKLRSKLTAWSKQIRATYGNKCAVCGSDRFIQAHHILPKERFPEYALEPDNGIALCPSHHKFGSFSFHRNPIWSALWLIANRTDLWNTACFRVEQDKRSGV